VTSRTAVFGDPVGDIVPETTPSAVLELNTDRLIIQDAEHNEPQHGTEHDEQRIVGWATRRKIIADRDLEETAGMAGCLISGDLEKLISPPIGNGSEVNASESKREQSGIIRRQFRGIQRVVAIFRGPLAIKVSLWWIYFPTWLTWVWRSTFASVGAE
jgi:hypothetical protein